MIEVEVKIPIDSRRDRRTTYSQRIQVSENSCGDRHLFYQ